MSEFPTYFVIILAGVLPAFLWLAFWLKEDALHPEPKKMIFLTFVFGMAFVPFAAALQHLFISSENGVVILSFFAIFWISLTEEVLKYAAAFFSSLRTKHFDEPIDGPIYLITAALGFSAMENILYIAQQIDFLQDAILIGILRFIGSTLLHVLASALIGIAIAFSFYKSRTLKSLYILVGIVGAVALHSVFNFLIIQDSGIFTLLAFVGVWIFVIILIVLFEEIKNFTSSNKKIWTDKKNHSLKD